ncbi:AAA family ATPase [Salinimicrobium tongyeongense]|uniref:AAA family ATPase n=1 Tax=Salinimicrobium tongyeongense TaxID=2809707 RepID=A0ABY6NPR7_9FLAO|nr:SbcC/MukB-like Walker B domain-containing protein [Salinimicrobium tongyeongense]UZH54891.1 AAA family ATPase [Salinimicrobium tongyeongense]
MKILKIEFQNINSLKGKHEIDFSKAPFTVSSLFAITGPTGSGKSTILDVISLALFNMVPRLGKISKNDIINKGALLTRNQKEAYAKVTYQAKKGIYASQWSISTNRNNNLRDYEMYLYDLATEKPLDYKKSDVPSKNEELIGLNYNQFIKSVLLAQGDFAQFLKAKKDERGELLEKITGTGIYRQVGIKAYQKFKKVNAEIEDRQREINVLQKDLLEEEVLQELTTALTQKSGMCEPLEKETRELERLKELKKNISSQQQQIAAQEKLQLNATQNLIDFEKEKGEKLKQHEQVQGFAGDLRKWQNLDAACREIKEELTRHARSVEENRTGISRCLDNISSFLKKEPATGEIESSLQDFSRKVRKLQQQRDEKLSHYRNLQERFDLELREVQFKLNGDLKTEELKLKQMKAAGEHRLQELQDQLKEIDLNKLEAERSRLRELLQQGRKAQQEWAAIANLSAEIERAKKEEEELLGQVENLPQELASAKKEMQLLQKDVENLQLRRENELLKSSLDEHRHNLRNGEACPLCGSTEHPYAAHLPAKNDTLQEELLRLKKELSAMERQVTSRETSLAHHQKRIGELQELIRKNGEKLEAQKRQFEEVFLKINPKGKDWEEFCNNNEEKIGLLEAFEKENRKLRAVKTGLPILLEIQEVLVDGKKIKAELDGLYSGKDIDTDCLELQNSWTSLQHQQNSLASQGKDLNQKLVNKTAELENLEKQLQAHILETGCKDIPEALQRLLPEAEYSQLSRKREALTSQKGQIEASLKTLKTQLTQLQQKDVPGSEEILTQKLQETKSKLNSLHEECEELRRKLRNDRERRAQIAAIEEELKDVKNKIKRWELLNQLIGDATGKKFNDFAQDLSLSQLLILANRRLQDLSDRYRIDKPLEDEDDSLVAIDEHMGGQRRSVKTLSGGETFLLSLSMALALSDLASRNVEINSLFIDEGFGTLDPETLDQTLDTLEKLQAESSKTIGIISHVDSLKERIATQIRLSRNGQGYSSLEVIG